MTDAVHANALRRLNRTGRSKGIGGRHATATDGDGVCARTHINPSGGTPLDVFDFTYNADGELTAASDDNSAYQYAYNADGEETSQADVGSPDLPTVTLTYEYDPDGNRTSMDDSLGGLVSYTYNARDELTNETLSGTDISAIAVANTYDNAGNMTGQTRYSNTAETDVVATTSYTYDDAEQMTGIVDKNSGGTTLVSYGYTYAAAGLVTQETRTWDSGSDSDTLDYTYTDNDQLTSVTHTNDAFANESFSYDANGNETGTGYTTSTGNEQTASSGYTYTYDADGNMITSTQTSTGDTWTYSYNFAGQMRGAVETNSDDTVISQTTYTYDALGNRIGMDENGTQTWTLYDDSDPIMDFNGSGSLEMRYLNGPTGDLVDSVIARESAGGTVAWYLPDRLGTVRDLINNSGSIIDHIDFSAFGTVLDQSDASEGDRMMGFAGMELDSVTEMNLAVYRVQNPGTGRWTSQDPDGFAAGSMNLGAYADNQPADLADPEGLCPLAGPQDPEPPKPPEPPATKKGGQKEGDGGGKQTVSQPPLTGPGGVFNPPGGGYHPPRKDRDDPKIPPFKGRRSRDTSTPYYWFWDEACPSKGWQRVDGGQPPADAPTGKWIRLRNGKWIIVTPVQTPPLDPPTAPPPARAPGNTYGPYPGPRAGSGSRGPGQIGVQP